VLPFANLSHDSEDDYFSDGITEEIINALAKVEGLRVAGRTSAFFFKGKTVDIAEIATKLNVATVLEGSVRKARNRVRISIRLIDAATGYQLWAERFDREMDDIFAVQDEIATTIAGKCGRRAAVDSSGPLVKTGTRNLEAYELYLKGRHAWERFGTQLHAAQAYFERAVTLDPDYALAHAGISDTYATLAFTAAMRPHDAMPRARAAAMRALELDDHLAEAHCALAYVNLLYDWNWRAAEQGFIRSIELNPNFAHAMHHYGHLYHAFISHELEAGIALCRRAVEVDPLAGYPRHGWIANLYIAGRTAEALDELHRTLERDPSAFHLRRLLGLCYLQQGEIEPASAAMEQAVRDSGRHPWALSELGCLHACTGRVAEAESIQAELVARSRTAYVQGTILSLIPAWLGRLDEGIEYLERAVEERDGVCIALTSWPMCAPFWSHQRYRQLLERIGLRDDPHRVLPAPPRAGRVSGPHI
jgi:TolB-like protein/tetratricopeptide (TPR) repeat protein